LRWSGARQRKNTRPSNKGMKQTSVEHTGRLQLIPGVVRTGSGATKRMTRLAAHGLLAAGMIAVCAACHTSGGLSAQVNNLSGAPVPNARLRVTFPSLFGESMTHDAAPGETGWSRIMWSHGSWRDNSIEVSAPGLQAIRTTFGNGHWDCTFTLAPQAAGAKSSASCRESP
jgi:hypothetical protein